MRVASGGQDDHVCSAQVFAGFMEPLQIGGSNNLVEPERWQLLPGSRPGKLSGCLFERAALHQLDVG